MCGPTERSGKPARRAGAARRTAIGDHRLDVPWPPATPLPLGRSISVHSLRILSRTSSRRRPVFSAGHNGWRWRHRTRRRARSHRGVGTWFWHSRERGRARIRVVSRREGIWRMAADAGSGSPCGQLAEAQAGGPLTYSSRAEGGSVFTLRLQVADLSTCAAGRLPAGVGMRLLTVRDLSGIFARARRQLRWPPIYFRVRRGGGGVVSIPAPASRAAPERLRSDDRRNDNGGRSIGTMTQRRKLALHDSAALAVPPRHRARWNPVEASPGAAHADRARRRLRRHRHQPALRAQGVLQRASTGWRRRRRTSRRASR